LSPSTMSDAYRAFIALALPPAVTDFLKRVQDCLVKEGVRARWVRPEGMHLTLKFLGGLPPEKMDDLAAAVDAVVRSYTPLELTAQGLGGFPNRSRPRVLWVGIGGQSARLADLQRHLESALMPLGWLAEKRPFRGHLTLARAKGRRPLARNMADTIEQCEPEGVVPFTAARLVLYRSHLRPTGAVYEALRQWDLHDAAS